MEITFHVICISAEIIALQNIPIVASVNRIPASRSELDYLLVVWSISAFELFLSCGIRKMVFSHVNCALIASTLDRSMEQGF